MADSLPVLGRFSQTVPMHLSTPSSTLCPQRPQHLIKHQEHVIHAFCAFCLPEIPPELTSWCVDMSPSGEIPTLGGISIASQHPTDHPLHSATPVLDITSTPCSPWILHTLFARNPSNSDSVVSKQMPPQVIFPHWRTFPLHPASHPLPSVTSVLDIRSRTCSPWILFTPFARNPLGTDVRPVIKPSKPSRGSAQAWLGSLHARFGLLGGPSWLLRLGSVWLSSPISCSSSAQSNRTEQRGCLCSAKHAQRS